MEGKALTMVITVSCVLVPSPLTLAADLGGVSLLVPPTPSPPRSAPVTLPPISQKLRKQEEDVQSAPRGIASACTCPRACSAQPNAGLAGAAGAGPPHLCCRPAGAAGAGPAAATPVLWLRLLPPAQLLSFSNSDQFRITLSPSVLDLNNP